MINVLNCIQQFPHQEIYQKVTQNILKNLDIHQLACFCCVSKAHARALLFRAKYFCYKENTNESPIVYLKNIYREMEKIDRNFISKTWFIHKKPSFESFFQ